MASIGKVVYFPGYGMYFLCVDDEQPALRRLIRTIKSVDKNIGVHYYSDSLEAKNFILHNRPYLDGAFLDVAMENINGIELAKFLRTIYPEIKIFFVTGFSEYAIEAYKNYIDGYILKPVNERVVKSLLLHSYGHYWQVQIKCFGNFTIWYQNREIKFRRSKSKELLAYLVDRRGTSVSTKECIAQLFGDRYDKSTRTQFAMLVIDIRKTLKEIGVDNLFVTSYNSYAINVNLCDCDYYLALNGDGRAIRLYEGEYMAQYSWAEETNGQLNFREL